MVAITFHHASPTRQPRRAVASVVTQAGVVGVALDVGLVDDVHPDLVAQVEEPWIVRVVRATHRSDVVPPHREEVVAHVVDRHRFAAGRVMIVAVDAKDPDRLAVHEQLPVADLDRSEPDELGVCLDDGAGEVEELGGDPIPSR